MVTVYVLHPFNFMIGFAWHNEVQAIEIFVGIFAINICLAGDGF
mgnify:CR=1 FL=1